MFVSVVITNDFALYFIVYICLASLWYVVRFERRFVYVVVLTIVFLCILVLDIIMICIISKIEIYIKVT